MINNIKAARKSKGYTQEKIGELLHVSQRSVASWETGTKEPDCGTLLKLADLYDVTVDYLLGRDADPREALAPDELRLLLDYRALSAQGQEYIRQQMYMAGQIYKKQSSDLPRVEAQG